MELRTQMIRLAYTQPHLREHLLPLLVNKNASYFEGVDLFVRLTILEGNAGVAAGSWSRNLKEGLRKAEAFFGNVLEPQWYNPKGTSFMDTFRRYLVKTGFSENDLEEAVSNLPLSTNFYRLGKYSHLEMTDFKHVMDNASIWEYRRAISWKRKNIVHQQIPLDWDTSADRTLERLAEMPEVWAWLRQFWAETYRTKPSAMNVLDIKLTNPSRPNSEISESLGFSKRTDPSAYVSKIVREALAAAKKAVEDGKAPERIMDLLDM